jgi:hypothetical protein
MVTKRAALMQTIVGCCYCTLALLLLLYRCSWFSDVIAYQLLITTLSAVCAKARHRRSSVYNELTI